ncbi:MAG: AAA family ATPase, partial [Terriglobales bacterium]
KAHPDVFNILLQVFEDGQLSDGLGNTVDFKNTIIIMTSNIGARHLQKRKGLGFEAASEEATSKTVEDLVKGEVKRTFNPEFLNRLDEVILFNPLTENDLIAIVELMVNQLNANLAQKSITVTVTEEARKWILDKTLVDRSYGARPLRRALQKYIEDPLSEALIQGTITTRPAFLEVYLDGDRLFYRQVGEEKAEGVLLYSN